MKEDSRITLRRLKDNKGWKEKILNEGLSKSEKLSDAETAVALEVLKKQAGIK